MNDTPANDLDELANVVFTISFCPSVSLKSLSSSSRYCSGDVILLSTFARQHAVTASELSSEKMLVCPMNENRLRNKLKLSSDANTRLRELNPTIFLTRSIESDSDPPETGVLHVKLM